MFGEEELIQIHKRRSLQIANIMVFCFVIVFVRLWYLQVYKGDLYHKFSLQNRLRKEVIRSPRGMMYSRNGILLVDNTPRFDAVLTRQFLQDEDSTLGRLSQILDMDLDLIDKIIKKNSSQAKYRPIVIKKNISSEEVAKIETENASLPGISVETFISRDYIDKEIGAHLLGYISEISQTQLPKYQQRDGQDYTLGDFIGQFGVEQRMDKILRGDNGVEFVEVDALGRKKKYINVDNLFTSRDVLNKDPTPGKNIKLTIDRQMQQAGYDALKGKSGSVVAIDVETGEVLTMISTPAFDPSQFSKGLTTEYWSSLVNNTENPLRDRSIQEHFPPGSTFKPFTAIAALEEGIIDKNTKLRCHGSFKFGRRVYRSWKRYGTEKMEITDALKNSCNIFFYKVAAELDIDVLAKYANLFGLGHKTGISLPREVSGLIPTKEWKLKRNGQVWQDGETLSCAVGQSYVLVSTMQLANAYAAIATRGKLHRPFIVKEVSNIKGEIVKTFKPELLKDIKLKESTWDLIQRGLYKVANEPGGTAFWRRGSGNQMAGKSGTAQVIKAQSSDDLYSKCSEMPYKYRHHGVFVAYAPFDNPKIAVAALVEHGCGGSSAAAPVVQSVINTYMKTYLPEKQKEYAKKERIQLTQYIKSRQQNQNKEDQQEEE